MSEAFLRNTLPADLEAIISILSSAGLEPIAGLSGMLAGKLGGVDAGVDAIKKTQGYAYQPRDPATLNSIGSALQVPLEYYEKGTQALGDAGNSIAGPVGGAIAKSLPEIIGAGFGLRQMAKAGAKNRPNSSQMLDGTHDPSRRKFIKNAGLMTAGAVAAPAILKKSLFDVSVPAGTKAVAATAAKAIPSVSPSVYSAAQTMNAMFKGMDAEDIIAVIDDIETRGTFAVDDWYGTPDLSIDGTPKKSMAADLGVHIIDSKELVAALRAPHGKIHMNKLEPIDMTYSDGNPLNSLIDGANNEQGLYSVTMAQDLDGKIIEGIAGRTIRPENFKADVRKYMNPEGKTEKLSYDLMEPEIEYLENILKSDDPIGELFQRASVNEMDMFGEISDRKNWLGRDEWNAKQVADDIKSDQIEWQRDYEEAMAKGERAWAGGE